MVSTGCSHGPYLIFSIFHIKTICIPIQGITKKNTIWIVGGSFWNSLPLCFGEDLSYGNINISPVEVNSENEPLKPIDVFLRIIWVAPEVCLYLEEVLHKEGDLYYSRATHYASIHLLETADPRGEGRPWIWRWRPFWVWREVAKRNCLLSFIGEEGWRTSPRLSRPGLLDSQVTRATTKGSI